MDDEAIVEPVVIRIDTAQHLLGVFTGKRLRDVPPHPFQVDVHYDPIRLDSCLNVIEILRRDL